MPPPQYRQPGGAMRVDLGSIAVMLMQWVSLQVWRLSKEGLGLFRKLLLECASVVAAPIVLPYTLLSSALGTCQLALRNLSVRAARQGRTPAGAIGRSLAQVFSLVRELPHTAPKYPFARAVAERILTDNVRLAPPLVQISRAALARAFLETMQALEAALHRERGASWVGAAVQRALLGGGTDGGGLGGGDADRPEKLARELLWMADKMEECGGLEDMVRLWSRGSLLAVVALSAPPRVQKPLVRLAASLCQAVGNNRVAASNSVRFQLLYQWLPLFCRATQTADGPVFNSFEKQETEEAIHRAIVGVPPGDREVLFATWLREYAWSSSDWPDLQKAYSQWCDLARMQALVVGAPSC